MALQDTLRLWRTSYINSKCECWHDDKHGVILEAGSAQVAACFPRLGNPREEDADHIRRAWRAGRLPLPNTQGKDACGLSNEERLTFDVWTMKGTCAFLQVAMVKDLSAAVLQAEKRKRAFGTRRRATEFEQGPTFSSVVKETSLKFPDRTVPKSLYAVL
eukprot:1160885-Pelagomonas_calceolata.AAC.8